MLLPPPLPPPPPPIHLPPLPFSPLNTDNFVNQWYSYPLKRLRREPHTPLQNRFLPLNKIFLTAALQKISNLPLVQAPYTVRKTGEMCCRPVLMSSGVALPKLCNQSDPDPEMEGGGLIPKNTTDTGENRIIYASSE